MMTSHCIVLGNMTSVTHLKNLNFCLHFHDDLEKATKFQRVGMKPIRAVNNDLKFDIGRCIADGVQPKPI